MWLAESVETNLASDRQRQGAGSVVLRAAYYWSDADGGGSAGGGGFKLLYQLVDDIELEEGPYSQSSLSAREAMRHIRGGGTELTTRDGGLQPSALHSGVV